VSTLSVNLADSPDQHVLTKFAWDLWTDLTFEREPMFAGPPDLFPDAFTWNSTETPPGVLRQGVYTSESRHRVRSSDVL
jgi:hypothetical protein